MKIQRMFLFQISHLYPALVRPSLWNKNLQIRIVLQWIHKINLQLLMNLQSLHKNRTILMIKLTTQRIMSSVRVLKNTIPEVMSPNWRKNQDESLENKRSSWTDPQTPRNPSIMMQVPQAPPIILPHCYSSISRQNQQKIAILLFLSVIFFLFSYSWLFVQSHGNNVFFHEFRFLLIIFKFVFFSYSFHYQFLRFY